MGEQLVQGRYAVAWGRLEPATFRLQGTEHTSTSPRPIIIFIINIIIIIKIIVVIITTLSSTSSTLLLRWVTILINKTPVTQNSFHGFRESSNNPKLQIYKALL